jgi:uncharacterized Zn finger protein
MARTKEPPTAGWEQLSWSDLEDWCGSRSLERGRQYFRSGQVHRLVISEDGTLLATVHGTYPYTTCVSLAGGPDEIDGACTCPIGGCCKHSVAVILTYLDALEKKQAVPAASNDDPRWERLENGDADWSDDYEDAEPDDEDIDELPARAVSRGPVRKRKSDGKMSAADRKERIPGMLAGWPAKRMVDYILEIAEGYPDIREDLEEQVTLQSGDVRELIRDTRKEIRRRAGEDAWTNRWDGDGQVPDYSGVERRFERLLAAGEYDALLDLGKELLDRGSAQVESSHDEGETASEIRQCLGIVARAVPHSNRPQVDQILYCLEMLESNQYDLSEPFGAVTDRKWPKKVWSDVADALLARPRPTPRGQDSFIERFDRQRRNGWIVETLEKAGREGEVLAFLEAETPITQDYAGLVRRLMAARRMDDARRWAMDGIAATKAQSPGIAKELYMILREMAEQAKDWPLVAAYDARPFLEHPSVDSFKDLLASAKKAGLADAVRSAALHFAETGRQPNGRKGTPAWPLPEVPDPPAKPSTERPAREAFIAREKHTGPHYEFLIDLAIEEKRPEDVLRWYDAWRADRKERFHQANSRAEDVADAVKDNFPERAIEVYRKGAESALVYTGHHAYEEAASHLRKLKAVLEKIGRAAEWKTYESQLREQHKRKRNFIEILDRLDRGRILGGRK